MIRYSKPRASVVLAALGAVAASGCLGPGGVLGDDQDPDVFLVGTITVSTQTTGATIDPDGYQASLDEAHIQSIGVNGSVSFEAVPAGTYGVLLSGVDGSCVVTTANPAFITLLADSTVDAQFDVDCP
ncbi:MAG: hypothetical protein AB7T31_01025 [Gemmatimonadales bacterium]